MPNNLPLEHYLTLSVSDDKLSASLRFSMPDELFTCSEAQLRDLLRAHHITHGIREDVLQRFAANPKGYLYDEVTIAMGDEPSNGRDGSVKVLFDLDNSAGGPAVMEDGRVDYREMNALNNVRRGQLIAEKIPPTEGRNGRAVTGEILFAKAGREAGFRMGKNVVMNDTQTALYALIDGLVTKTERERLNVFPVYEVNGNVDFRVGNIDFVGNVVIRGNVLPGFRVKAAGDIRITGGVESADIVSDGSIEIAEGVLGHNKGLIKALGSVRTSFVQEGNVEAGEDVVVSQSIMHSQVRAGRNVHCTGSKGLIVGGIVQAGEKILARTVGNSTSTATILEVGVLPELRQELGELRDTLKSIAENLDKTDKALQLLDQLALSGNLPQDKMALKIKLGATKKQLLDEREAGKDRILAIEQSLEDMSKAGADIAGTVYPGARIIIGRYTRYVKDAAKRASFRFVEGEITMSAMPV